VHSLVLHGLRNHLLRARVVLLDVSMPQRRCYLNGVGEPFCMRDGSPTKQQIELMEFDLNVEPDDASLEHARGMFLLYLMNMVLFIMLFHLNIASFVIGFDLNLEPEEEDTAFDLNMSLEEEDAAFDLNMYSELEGIHTYSLI
jgi:hypothetical protein